MRQQKNRSVFAQFILVICLATATAIAITGAQAEPIQLGIQHDEILPPLPSQYQAGAEVNEAPPQQHIEWFPIPAWMAGTWSKQGDMEDDAVNLLTGQRLGQPVFIPNSDSISFGDQYDNKGAVWHAEVLPFSTGGYSGKTENRRTVTQMRCVSNTAQQVVLQVRSFVTAINMKKKKVKDSKQQDEIITFQPLNAQQCQTISSTRTYLANGQASMQSKSHTTRSRTAPFTPVAVLNGIDLKRSLADFLTEHNWAYLIPQ